MQFFTKELFARLNSGDPKAMEAAMTAWEQAIADYHVYLEHIRDVLPESAKTFNSQQIFHDAQLITFSYAAERQFVIMLRGENRFHLVSYHLGAEPLLGEPDEAQLYTSEGKHWLYDEFQAAKGPGASHHVLFSDGSEVVIPFSEMSVQSFEVHPLGAMDKLRQSQAKSLSKKKSLRKAATGTRRRSGKAPPVGSIISPADLSALDHLTPVFTLKKQNGKYGTYAAIIDPRKARRAGKSD